MKRCVLPPADNNRFFVAFCAKWCMLRWFRTHRIFNLEICDEQPGTHCGSLNGEAAASTALQDSHKHNRHDRGGASLGRASREAAAKAARRLRGASWVQPPIAVHGVAPAGHRVHFFLLGAWDHAAVVPKRTLHRQGAYRPRLGRAPARLFPACNQCLLRITGNGAISATNSAVAWHIFSA